MRDVFEVMFRPTHRVLERISKRYNVFSGTNAELARYVADTLEENGYKITREGKILKGDYLFADERKGIKGVISRGFELGVIPISFSLNGGHNGFDKITYFRHSVPPKIGKYIMTEEESDFKTYMDCGLIKYV